MIQRRSVAIIGTGNVGVAAAYALFNQRTASEIILVDINEERARGEAMDLMHGQLLVGNVTVRAGSYEDLKDTQVVVVTAGVGHLRITAQAAKTVEYGGFQGYYRKTG